VEEEEFSVAVVVKFSSRPGGCVSGARAYVEERKRIDYNRLIIGRCCKVMSTCRRAAPAGKEEEETSVIPK
jgi:carbonic anhydrase/acetyltransferase-like protein (isoleucine patch superfamily)